MSRYVFANAWELARRRLALLEQTADLATHAWLHRLGIMAGRDYWDVGAGGGWIVRWLSQQAGSSLCKIWHLYSGGAYGTVKAVRTTGLAHRRPWSSSSAQHAMSDAAMRLVRETFDTGRPLVRSVDLVVDKPGPINYRCAECHTLLIRGAGVHLPDVIVICPECLALNEVD